MRKITLIAQLLLILTLSTPAFSQTATPPSVGDGSESNPYQIVTLDNLYWLTQSDTVWDKHFIQTADINASESSGWENDSGFTPIGNITIAFTGSYNGKGHIIDSIIISRLEDNYIGMFGVLNTNAYIDSLGLTNINIKGNDYVGGLVGCNNNGKITNSYTTGTCHRNSSYADAFGGLVGHNKGTISYCYSEVDVTTGGQNVGGLVGVNDSIITNSFSTGKIHGKSRVGGLVGLNRNTVEKCYSRSDISYSFPGVAIRGGLIGYSQGGVVVDSFWDIDVSEEYTSWGGLGLTTAEMQDSIIYLNAGWDFMGEIVNGFEDIWGFNNSENDGYPFLKWQSFSNTISLECQAPFSSVDTIIIGDITENTINLKGYSQYGNGNTGYSVFINDSDIWVVPDDGSEPVADTSWKNLGQQCIYFGTSYTPDITVTGLHNATEYYFKVYAYTNCGNVEKYEQSGTLTSQPTKAKSELPSGDGSESDPYIIANLENLAWVMYNDSVWNKKFLQTADINASETINWDEGKGFTPIGNSTKSFTGTYEGNGHIIDSLNINRPNEDNVGLFGKVVNANIDSLGLTNVNIKGLNTVGGLIAYVYSGNVSNCYSEGSVQGNDEVGGLVGKSFGTISNSYSVSNVTGVKDVGGLVGINSHNPYGPYTNDYCGKIRNSFSLSNTVGRYRIGGFAGKNSGNIKNSYSSGDVEGNKEVGGLVGNNYEFDYSIGPSTGHIMDSYSSTFVKGDELVGGFIGINWSGDIAGSFWDIEESGQTKSSGGAVGLITSEMKDIQTFLLAGWDFMDEIYNGTEDVWGINSNENDGYPFLKCQRIDNTLQCQAPFNSASDLIFGDVTINNVNLKSFTEAGYGAIGYAIYINSENIWINPEDGDEPSADTLWQNEGQQCIYFDTLCNPNITVSGLTDNTRYYIKIFAYNVCNGVKVFEQTGVETQVTTKVLNTAPTGGGSERNPYLIFNLENLAWVMYNEYEWDAHYKQMADIDASASKNWSSGKGFKSIGRDTTFFTGTYDGNGYVIDQLTINQKDSLIGLFGILGMDATIENLGLTKMSIKGERYVGGIAGLNYGGEINSCFTTGSCEGNSSTLAWGSIGGLVGYNLGAIKYCYSDAAVASKYDLVGGLTGYNDGFISCSYSAGSAKGNNYVGGLTGASYYIIYDCYSRSDVTGNNYEGGLVGHGYDYYVLSSFWDTEASGQNTSYGGVGLTTDLMKKTNEYVSAKWDFMDETANGRANIWGLNSNKNDGYPFLWWQGFENTEIVTSVIDILNNESVKIYPNPVYDKLHIKFKHHKEAKLVISNINGQQIIKKDVDSLIETIDMLEFKSGVYIVTIYAGADIYSKKIIKR